MSYQKWREEFLTDFGRAFPAAGHMTALRLLRAATAEQRWNEIDCSIEIGDRERARQERASERRMARVKEIAGRIGAGLLPNGDPRGCPFAIVAPDGREIAVPGRGLPARCFA